MQQIITLCKNANTHLGPSIMFFFWFVLYIYAFNITKSVHSIHSLEFLPNVVLGYNCYVLDRIVGSFTKYDRAIRSIRATWIQSNVALCMLLFAIHHTAMTAVIIHKKGSFVNSQLFSTIFYGLTFGYNYLKSNETFYSFRTTYLAVIWSSIIFDTFRSSTMSINRYNYILIASLTYVTCNLAPMYSTLKLQTFKKRNLCGLMFIIGTMLAIACIMTMKTIDFDDLKSSVPMIAYVGGHCIGVAVPLVKNVIPLLAQ